MHNDKTLLIYAQDYVADGRENACPSEDFNIPLGILYLGSYLKSKGRAVKLMDTRLYKKEDFFAALRLELTDTLLVGFSITTPCVKTGLEIAKYIKLNNPAIKIVWGGVHASLFPQATVDSKYIDYVIVKEGEIALCGLAEHLSGANKEITQIPNLYYKGENGIKRNSEGGRNEHRDDPNFIGIADYSLLDMEKYVERTIAPGRKRRQVEMLTARGCPYRCAFCINTILYEHRWTGELPERTLDRLDALIGNYRLDHVFFMDEDFFCYRKRTKSLVAEIAKRNITWEANCRADYIDDGYLDNELLGLMRESGCVKLRFGLESGSQRILDLLKKDITTKDSMKMAERLNRCGIVPAASFMMGLPGETVSDIIKTAGLISRLSKINPAIIISGPAIFRPYPGSEMFKKCEARGMPVPKSLNEWSDFYMHNNLDAYPDGVPWFKDVYIFKRVWLCLAHLKFNMKNKFLKYTARLIVSFHLFTRLKLVEAEYSLYKWAKKAA